MEHTQLCRLSHCLERIPEAARWCLALAGERIVAGLGVIENDFHPAPTWPQCLCRLHRAGLPGPGACRAAARPGLCRVGCRGDNDPLPAHRPHRLLRAVRLGVLLHRPAGGGAPAHPGLPASGSPDRKAGITRCSSVHNILENGQRYLQSIYFFSLTKRRNCVKIIRKSNYQFAHHPVRIAGSGPVRRHFTGDDIPCSRTEPNSLSPPRSPRRWRRWPFPPSSARW